MRRTIHSVVLAATAALSLQASVVRAGAQAAATATAIPPATTFVIKTNSDAARAAFAAGYAAYLEFDPARAAAGFQRAFAADTGLALARAFELNVRGRSQGVADAIDRLRLSNGAANLVETLMFMSLREWALVRPGPSSALLDAAVRLVPTDNNLLAHYHLSLAIGSNTRIAIARALRQREPDAYRSHAYLAYALNAPADSSEALTAMNEALRLGRDRPFAHWVAGELMTRMGRYDEAAAHYGHALQRDPDYYIAARDRGQVALYQGRFADARRDFQTVQDRTVYSVDLGLARRAYALTSLHEGKLDEAINEMNRVVQLFESQGGWRSQPDLAHWALSLMTAVKKDVAGVERHNLARKRILGDNAGGVLFGATVSWALAGKPDRARMELTAYETLAETEDFNPPATDLAALRAMVQAAEGNHNQALETAANNTNFWARLASYHALIGLGRAQEARELMQTLLNARNYAIDNVTVPLVRLMYRGQ